MTQQQAGFSPPDVSLAELIRVFTRIGFLSFGGPAAQIALMHRELVAERKWVSEQDYLSALSFCMLLPGPEAMQLATWIGWRKHGTLGGLITGGLFVIPGAVIVLILSMIYAVFGQVPFVMAIFTGVQAAVIAIVLEALLRVARKALKTNAHWINAVLAFCALFVFALPFPLVIGLAALWGFFTTKSVPQPTSAPFPSVLATMNTVLIWLAIWLLPLVALAQFESGILAEIGAFFSKLALLTFGGAYAVLAWMAQDVVQQKEWLTFGQMMHGLGLAETTPGPLILVTEFVGFMAAHKQGGIPLGIAGAAVALWMTFAPCFLWIFAGAPWLAHLTKAPRLAGALQAITAAVVGVIANLSLWFALHTLFSIVQTHSFGLVNIALPNVSSLKPIALVIALLSGYLLLILHKSIVFVLCSSAFIAILVSLVRFIPQ